MNTEGPVSRESAAMPAHDAASPFRVLVVAAATPQTETIAKQLRTYSAKAFHVTRADSLAAALALFVAQEFDAALVGLSLADSSGVQTVSRMRFAAPRVPIVVLGDVDDDSLALAALQHGAQDYLLRSRTDVYVLARVLHFAVERQRSEDELRRAHDLLEQRVMERTAFLKVTNRRLSEEIAERARAEDVLRKERDFTSAILDTVDAIVVVMDTAGRIVRCNRCCESTTGYSEQEVRGRFVWDIFLEPARVDEVRSVFSSLVHKLDGYKHENHWRTRHGSLRLIDWSNTVILDAQGNVEFVIATGIDITERRHAEELEHRHMVELAHVSRLSTMGQMATEIAHELNQPLCAIASYGDTCLRMYESKQCSPDEVRRVLKEITTQAERASEVIRRIRKFVRKDDGDRAAVSLNELVSDVVRLTQVEARWNRVTIATDLGTELPPVIADKILIEQVIMNLVRNAIEAIGHAETARREVTISTRSRGGGTLEVVVEDTGPGIPAAGAEALFQPFFTTKPTGMGMGLSLSRSIAEAHGGELVAEPGSNSGAIFRLVLPAIKEEQRNAARSHRIRR
jgi:PAS domain S-box-containing protein